jgi:large repetitive protein
MAEGPSLRHTPSEPEPVDDAAGGGLFGRARGTLSSRDIALKVAVASIATVVLSHLGPLAALGGIAVSLMVESGVERLVRRLRTKPLWAGSVLFLFLGKADRFLSAIGLRGRAGATSAAATTACAAVAGALVIGAVTVPELAIGHSVTASRSLTFFGDRNDVGERHGVLGGSVTRSATKFSLPRSVKAKAVPMTGAIVRYHASTSSGKVVCTPASGTFFRIGRTTVRCTARVNGRVARRSFTVVVADETPPRLKLPRNITSQAAASDGVVVTYVATSSDDLDGKTVARCTPGPGSRFPVGRTTVHCTAVDEHANTATGSFTVTVDSVESDQLVLPPEVTVEAASPAGTVVRYPASANGSAVSCNPQSASRFPLGDTVVSCQAGGETGTFQVSVVDTTAPQVFVPPEVSANATSKRGAAVTYTVTARDTVDGAIVPSCAPRSGATFAIGRTVVRCTIADSHGNERQKSFDVQVVDGPPKLDLPATATAAAVDARGAQVTLDYTAKDAVDGPVDVRCGHANQIFPIGRTTVTCTAKDSAGNTVSSSLVVVVRDQAAPRITLPSGTVAANATGPKGGVATWNVSAVDNVDGALPVSCDRASGDVFAIGDTQVTCSARDRAGNLANGSFTVAVRDRAAPHITVPSDTVVAGADDWHGARVTFSVTATDAVDGTIAATCDPQAGSMFPLGQTTVSCTARDAAGNAAQPASFTVAVRDLTPPRFDLPNSPFTAPTIDANGGPVQFTATAYDAVDGTLDARCDPSSGETFPFGRTRVTCTATDKAGNTGTDSFIVRLVDTDAPTLYLPDSPLTAFQESFLGANVEFSTSAVDNVDGSVPVICDHQSGDLFPAADPFGDTVVSCSASDQAGNATSGAFVVRVFFD